MIGEMTHPQRESMSRLEQIDAIVAEVEATLGTLYPDDLRCGSQPIHTVYVSAADGRVDLGTSWGQRARSLADAHLGFLTDLDTHGVLPSVLNVLADRPIQDLRLDFEDGYGDRGDGAEDRDARSAGIILRAFASGFGAVSCGVRIKGITSAEFRRSLRTLELVLDSAGGVVEGFVFTIPKLRAEQQVRAAVLLCEELELAHGLPDGSMRFELQIESPQAVIAADGTVLVAKAIRVSESRCSALHYGTYDYSAACSIASPYQSLDHPIAHHAKAVMSVAAAQTGVWVCDGSTQVVPDGSHQHQRTALRHHYDLVTQSLSRGYYQGWDMHPGHLITRWLATFGFYRGILQAAAPRLETYLHRKRGAVIDEPATAAALASGVVRGMGCGAFSEDDLTALAPSCDTDTLRRLLERRMVR
jgi:citrate lyase beta subunit